MRIPKNIIIESKYTSGKEYMIKKTYREYIGYYYELNGKFFAGKEFKSNSPQITKIDAKTTNTLLTNPALFIYGKVSKIISNGVIPTSYNFNTEIKKDTTRYFYKQTNVTPPMIKEVDKNTFDALKTNPIYQTISLKYFMNGGFNELDVVKASKKMPGLKSFLDVKI